MLEYANCNLEREKDENGTVAIFLWKARMGALTVLEHRSVIGVANILIVPPPRSIVVNDAASKIRIWH